MTENAFLSDLEPVPKVSSDAAHKNASEIVDITNEEVKSTEKYNDEASTEKVNEDIICKYPGVTISRLPAKIRNEKKEFSEGKTDNNRNVVKGRMENLEGSLLERALRFIPRSDLVGQIMELGICKNAAVNALFFTGNSSVELASNFILDDPVRAGDFTLKDRVLDIIERQRKEKLAAMEMQNKIVDAAIQNYRRTRSQDKQAASSMVRSNHHDGESPSHPKPQYGEMCPDAAGDMSAYSSRRDHRISDATPQNQGHQIGIGDASSIKLSSKEMKEDNMENVEKETHLKSVCGDKKVSFDVSHQHHHKEYSFSNLHHDQYTYVRDMDDSDQLDEEMMEEEDMGTEYKMVLVFNSELHMNGGILAEHTAKATLGLANIIKQIPINCLLGPEEFSLWEECEERMETLKADTDSHLTDLELMAEDLDLPNYTAFIQEEEKPKRAVLALFGSDDVVDKVTGRLKAMDSSD